MRNLYLLAVLGLSFNVALAQTQPPRTAYPEARKLYDQFDKTLSSAMLWEKKPPQERSAAVKAAMAHQEKIIRMWGEPSQCAAAAAAHVELVTFMNQTVSYGQGSSNLKTFDVLGSLRNAERLGNYRAGCYDDVEALDVPGKK